MGHPKAITVFDEYLNGNILNLGCGNDYIDGWINLDWNGKADVLADMRDPWPFEDGTFNAIWCSHVLEHFGWDDVCHILIESHRVLVPNGALCIRVPHLTNFNAFTPFHKSYWWEDTFRQLDGRDYGDTTIPYRIPLWDAIVLGVAPKPECIESSRADPKAFWGESNLHWNMRREIHAVMIKRDK